MWKKEKVRRSDLSVYSDSQLKKYSLYLTAAGVPLILAGIAAALFLPALAFALILIGAICVMAGQDYKNERKRRETLFKDQKPSDR